MMKKKRIGHCIEEIKTKPKTGMATRLEGLLQELGSDWLWQQELQDELQCGSDTISKLKRKYPQYWTATAGHRQHVWSGDPETIKKLKERK